MEPDKGPGVVGSGAGGCVGCGGIDWVCDCPIVGAFGGNSSSESSESDNTYIERTARFDVVRWHRSGLRCNGFNWMLA